MTPGGFLSLVHQFVLRGLASERLRALTALAGIALGTATIVAIRQANVSVVDSFEIATAAVAGNASLRIAGPTGRFDELLYRDLMWLRELGEPSPVIEGYVMIGARRVPGSGIDVSQAATLKVLGVDVLQDRPVRSYQLVRFDQGTRARDAAGDTWTLLRLTTDLDAIVLTQRFATEHGLALGDPVEVLAGDRTVTMRIRGLLEEEGPARAFDGAFALMDIATAQEVLGRIGVLDGIDLELRDGLSLEEARAALQRRLPAGLVVQDPVSSARQLETMVEAFHFNLTALSALALIVGLFLIYNTASFSVLRRRREIGRLRAVGAGRRLVLALFLGEALLIALPGALLGIVFGQALARAAVTATSGTVSTFYVAEAAMLASEGGGLGAAGVLALVGLVLALALVAAWAPAWEATRVRPTEAARWGERAAAASVWRPVVMCGVLAAASWGLAQLPPLGGLPVAGYAAAVAAIFAAAALVPATIRWASRAQDMVLTRLRGGRTAVPLLARASLETTSHRVSVSIAALVTALAMTVAIGVMVGSFRTTVLGWLEQSLAADLYVRPATMASAVARSSISPEAVAILEAHPRVLASDQFVRQDLDYDGRRITLGARDLAVLAEHGSLVLVDVDDARSLLLRAAGDGSALVSESFAYRFGVGAGDTIELPTSAGARPFLVAAVYKEYADNRGFVLLDRTTHARHFATAAGAEGAADVALFLEPGADPAVVRDELRASLPGSVLFFRTARGVKDASLRIFDSTFAITTALQAIAVVVAVLGIVATLVTLLLERRRELAILHFLGAGRRLIRAMMVLEALVLAAVAQGLGLILGIALAAILVFVINLQSFGWSIDFRLPWGFLARSSMLVLAAGAVGGLYPALRAQRLQAIRFVAEE